MRSKRLKSLVAYLLSTTTIFTISNEKVNALKVKVHTENEIINCEVDELDPIYVLGEIIGDIPLNKYLYVYNDSVLCCALSFKFLKIKEGDSVFVVRQEKNNSSPTLPSSEYRRNTSFIVNQAAKYLDAKINHLNFKPNILIRPEARIKRQKEENMLSQSPHKIIQKFSLFSKPTDSILKVSCMLYNVFPWLKEDSSGSTPPGCIKFIPLSTLQHLAKRLSEKLNVPYLKPSNETMFGTLKWIGMLGDKLKISDLLEIEKELLNKKNDD